MSFSGLAELCAPSLHSRVNLISWNSFTPVKLIEACLNFGSHFVQMKFTQTILIVQKAKSFANHFAC